MLTIPRNSSLFIEASLPLETPHGIRRGATTRVCFRRQRFDLLTDIDSNGRCEAWCVDTGVVMVLEFER